MSEHSSIEWTDGRPMQKEWVLSLRDQCARTGVPFLFKQWGGVRKSKAGRELDGRTYDDVPGRREPRVSAHVEQHDLPRGVPHHQTNEPGAGW